MGRRGPKPGTPSPLRGRPSPIRKSARNQMICDRLRQGGITMSELARQLSITSERVRQIALKDGITGETIHPLLSPTKIELRARDIAARRVARKERKDALIAQIIALRDENKDQRTIAGALNTSQATISAILIAAGHRTYHRPIIVFKAKKPKRKRSAPLIIPPTQNPRKPHDPDLVCRALELWRRGKSAGQIARKLTSPERVLTKNVIIGLAHRNDFPERPSPIKGGG